MNRVVKSVMFLCVSVLSPAMADLAWRVDFNAAASGTESTSNFTGWVVSSTSRTQVFANVDGGAESSNLTVVLTGFGGSAYSTFARNMSGGAVTNLYRDGAQYNGIDPGDFLNLSLRGLAPGQSYQVRLWYYDYSFSATNVQAYYEITDGANQYLGSLTNTVANAAGGSPLLPADLYDSRYVLTTPLSAGAAGTIDLQLLTGNSNQKLNALEVVAVVPEPVACSLMLLNVVLLAGLQRLRRKP